MLYLLDANVLIRAQEDYYPIDRVPQFWQWLHQAAIAGHAKVPFEIYNEIAVSTGLLADWISSTAIKSDIILDERVDGTLVQTVLARYAADLSDSELEEIGQDPFWSHTHWSTFNHVASSRKKFRDHRSNARIARSPMYAMI